MSRDRHQLIGHFNPRCAVCGQTVMQIQRQPDAPCRRYTLPFDEDSRTPAKAGLETTEKKAVR